MYGFWKNQEKPSKITTFRPFWLKIGIFMMFFLIFSETVDCKKLGVFALNSVHQDASSELSIAYFGHFFIFFIIRGDPSDLGRVKIYQHRK